MGRLLDDAGKLVMSAEALALAGAPLDFEAERPTMDELSPDESKNVDFPFRDPEPSYGSAMDLRFARGAFGMGDVMAWMRMRVALIEGAQPSPLERTLTAADSGNGVSQRVNLREYTFVNPDLTVTLNRPAEGEWIGMGSRTDFDGNGTGLADTRLYDEGGPIGRGIQTLLVRKRG